MFVTNLSMNGRNKWDIRNLLVVGNADGQGVSNLCQKIKFYDLYDII